MIKPKFDMWSNCWFIMPLYTYFLLSFSFSISIHSYLFSEMNMIISPKFLHFFHQNLAHLSNHTQSLLSPYTLPYQLKSKSPLPPAKPVVSNFGCTLESPVETWYKWFGEPPGLSRFLDLSRWLQCAARVENIVLRSWLYIYFFLYSTALLAIRITGKHDLEISDCIYKWGCWLSLVIFKHFLAKYFKIFWRHTKNI